MEVRDRRGLAARLGTARPNSRICLLDEFSTLRGCGSWGWIRNITSLGVLFISFTKRGLCVKCKPYLLWEVYSIVDRLFPSCDISCSEAVGLFFFSFSLFQMLLLIDEIFSKREASPQVESSVTLYRVVGKSCIKKISRVGLGVGSNVR